MIAKIPRIRRPRAVDLLNLAACSIISIMVVAGCAGSNRSSGEHRNNTIYKNAAAQRAEFDLECGGGSVTTQLTGGGGNSLMATVGVTGCGHKASYVCRCDGSANLFGAILCRRAVCALDGTSAPASTPAAG